ncbi:testis-expressed protein 2-like [Tubulanus polymorphus]|uniref:testis-expressed protein 2-like n=1 Tax=Tubulanus polymorphus TaxID=672921 RepID=UPI003DA4E14B
MASRKDKFLPSRSTKDVPNFSIRFNPSLHDSDGEDEDLFSISDSLKFERKRAATIPAPVTTSSVKAAAESQKRPSSIPVAGGEKNNGEQNSGKFSNLLDEIKEKIADPLNVISEKINSLSPLQSPNSQPTSPRRQSEVNSKVVQNFRPRKLSDSGLNVGSASRIAADATDSNESPSRVKDAVAADEVESKPRVVATAAATTTVEKPLLDLKTEIENLLSFESSGATAAEKPKKKPPPPRPHQPSPKTKTKSDSDHDKSFDDIFSSEPLEDFLGNSTGSNAELWRDSHTLENDDAGNMTLSNNTERDSSSQSAVRPPDRADSGAIQDAGRPTTVAMTMSSLLSCATPEEDDAPAIDAPDRSDQSSDSRDQSCEATTATRDNDTTTSYRKSAEERKISPVRPPPLLPGQKSSRSDIYVRKEDDKNKISSENDRKIEPSVITTSTTDQSDQFAFATLKQKFVTDLPRFPLSRVVVSSALLFLYLIVPWPPYVAGMIVGAVVAATSIAFYLWLMKEPTPKEPFEKFVPPLNELPALVVPEIKENRNSDANFRGWMNELPHYDPDDYHINQTNSVFLTLENATLRLQRPRHNVPKRAMWDETTHSPKFIHQRYYDLKGCTVRLVPGDLVKKRLWSKKYPICLIINKQTQSGVNAVNAGATMTKSPPLSTHSSLDDADFEKGFEFVSKEACDEVLLYLFARTNREKEEWYRRFSAAAAGVHLNTRLADILTRSVSADFKRCRQNSTDSISSMCSDPGAKDATTATTTTQDEQTVLQQEYARSMAKVIPADASTTSRSRSYSLMIKDMQRGGGSASIVGQITCDPQMFWFNALLTRTFYDFIRDKYYADKVSEKIQKKLSKIRVPYFIDELTITEIELGTEMPVVRRASKPYLDERGMWFDADIAYNGGFRMTLETKVNLMKFKKSQQHREKNVRQTNRSAITHSDEEDSVESSSDSDTEENTIPTAADEQAANAQPANSTQKKLLRIVDKITQSKYFQQATEIKYIKKAMEEVSNTPIILSVEVHSLVGVLTVNIPPPPTDRLWYGFRTNPRLWISAKPKVGERAVTVTHITEWIEKKLALEFQKVFVLPNMDDLVLPIMNEGHVDNPS